MNRQVYSVPTITPTGEVRIMLPLNKEGLLHGVEIMSGATTWGELVAADPMYGNAVKTLVARLWACPQLAEVQMDWVIDLMSVANGLHFRSFDVPLDEARAWVLAELDYIESGLS